MNLTLSEDQILIRENAQKFLDLNYSFEKRQDIILKNKKLPFDYWKKYAELGWLGLAFSENVGGYDGNINNLMTLMECLGSSLILEPIIFNNIIKVLYSMISIYMQHISTNYPKRFFIFKFR